MRDEAAAVGARVFGGGHISGAERNGRQDDLNAARIHTYLAQAGELPANKNKESMNSLFLAFLFS